jgi:hypothetical protein
MRVLVAGMMLALQISPVLAAESVAMLAARADLSCVQFSAIGVCRRNTPPFVGVKVRYWQPTLLIETTKRSGHSGIIEFAPLVRSLAVGVREDASGSGAGQADTTSLQMNEAHVFGFPFASAISAAIEAPCEGPPDFAGTVSYLSEQDAQEWRSARLEEKNPLALMSARAAPMCETHGPMLPGMCVGNWGPLYPRTGFSVHASEPVASALSAFRAADIAALKPQTPHRVVSPVLFWPSVRFDRLQLVSPVTGQCMAVGADPRYWESGKRSREGRYVWVYWRKKECCLF